MRLSPFYDSWYLYVLGDSYRLKGQFINAIGALRDSIYRSPENLWPRVFLTATYMEAGQENKARVEAEKIYEIDSNFQAAEFVKRALPYKNQGEANKVIALLSKAGMK